MRLADSGPKPHRPAAAGYETEMWVVSAPLAMEQFEGVTPGTSTVGRLPKASGETRRSRLC